MKKKVLTYAFAKYSTVIMGLLINAILSRILSPADYGIVAVVTVFTSFFNVLSTMGIDTGIIQNRDLSKEDTDNLFSLSVWIAIVFGSLFFLGAKPVSHFYDESKYTAVIRILSISVMLNILNIVPNAILMKMEKFKTITVRMIITTFISGGFAIFIAFIGGKYYALIIQTILSAALQWIWNMYNVKPCFHIKINIKSYKKIFGYSSCQFIHSLLIYFSSNLDNLLIGKVMGSEQLAYYNKSYVLMRYPIDYIPHAISPALHPILSKFQEDSAYIYKKYLDINKVLSLAGVLISLIFFGEAEEIIEILFGNQWQQAVLPFKIFALGVGIQIINAFFGVLYLSTNHTKNMLLSGLISTCISLIGIAVGIKRNNIVAVSILLVVSWYIKFGIESFFAIRKSLKQSLHSYFLSYVPDVFIFITSFLLFVFVQKFIKFGIVCNLVVKTLIICLLFVFSCICFGQMKYINRILKKG